MPQPLNASEPVKLRPRTVAAGIRLKVVTARYIRTAALAGAARLMHPMQFNIGGAASSVGGPDVRAASDCTIPPTPAPTMPLPEQLHIAYGNSADEMVVTFAIKDNAGVGFVRWSLDATGPLQQNVTTSTVNSGAGRYIVHHATINQLVPGAVHQYQAGWASTAAGDIIWSSAVSFVAQINDTSRPVRLAMFGILCVALNIQLTR